MRRCEAVCARSAAVEPCARDAALALARPRQRRHLGSCSTSVGLQLINFVSVCNFQYDRYIKKSICVSQVSIIYVF